MTTYTQTGREALIQELAHGQKYNTSNGELLDMSYVMSDAANVITSLSDELEKLRAAPSTSQPLTNIEVEALAICRRAGHVSVSQVQRILSIGYNEAGEICQSIIDKGQCNELEITPSLKTHSTPLAAPSTSLTDATEIKRLAGGMDALQQSENELMARVNTQHIKIRELNDELDALKAAPSTSPEMSDDLHIAYMAGYNTGKLAESNQWQPIETAPKDGTSVLTWCDPCVEICFMHGSVWITGRCDDFGEAETPTHWMPLPPPAK